MYISAPAPLKPKEFYVLLTLTQADSYGYGIRNSVRLLSHGAVTIEDKRLYPLLGKLIKEGLLEYAGNHPAAGIGQPELPPDILRLLDSVS